MRYIGIFFSLLIVTSSCFRIDDEGDKRGTVNFSDLEIAQFNNHAPGGRLVANSEWLHVFPQLATLEIVERASGQTYQLNIDPNNFTQPYDIELPFGTYDFSTVVTGEAYEDYLPFVVEGEFNLAADRINVVMEGSTNYGLITVKNEYVESAILFDGATEIPFATTTDDLYFYKYVMAGNNPRLEVSEAFDSNGFEREVEVQARTHYHFYLRLPDQDDGDVEVNEGTVTIIELMMGEFEYTEDYFEIGQNINRVWDNDGNVYRVVKIGNQYWMAENLRTSTYCNGDEIPHLPGGEEWMHRTEEAWTYYDNVERHNDRYGKLYNGAVVRDERNPCPCGWRIPSEDDWNEMIEYLGGHEVAGGKMKVTGIDHWNSPNRGATNESGFSAKGGGFLFSLVEPVENHERAGFSFYLLKLYGSWWSSTEFTFESEYSEGERSGNYRFAITNSNPRISQLGGSVDEFGNAHSIRCIME